MQKMTHRIASLFLALMLLMSFAAPAFAADDSLTFGDLGSKTATKLVRPGQYEITLSVPGAVETEEYSEIIVMVDASSSQGTNLDKLKSMLIGLAEDVLHNDGSMRLTLMGFGMGPRRVGSFYNAETLAAYLKDVTQADLRQGVSATNCEAALEYVEDYINASGKLNKTFVIFTSDGMTNMDETGFALSAWLDHPEWYMSGATAPMIARYAAGGQADLLMTEGTILTPTYALYPELSLDLELARKNYGLSSDEYSAAVDALYNAITASEEAGIAYTEALWEDVYAYSGMTFADDALYSTSEVEKAFLVYHDGIATNSFLCTIHGMKNASFYPDWYNLGTWGARAAEAADSLANNNKVTELYMMDFASKNNTWMNPASTTANHCTSDKITYNTASNFSAAVDKIETLADEIFVTVYKNTTVTDPMSKWVTLDPSSIRIYEDDLLIYRHGEGWLYEDKQPAANPITLEKNDAGRYQITWRIKDGNLLYSDRYYLKYIVDVDETAEGFEYNTDYPANDPTYVTYTDAKGEEKSSNIEVPDVQEPDGKDNIPEGEQGFEIYKSSSVDGTPISGIQFDVYKVVPAAGEHLSPQPAEEEYSKYMTAENKIGTITTDSNGYGYMNLTDMGLGNGFYLIVEQANSKVKAPVAPFYVSMPMPDPETGALMDVVVMYPKNETTKPTKPIEPDIPDEPDEPTTGKIAILKHCEGNEALVLAGAEFQVYRIANEGEEAVITTTHGDQTVGLVPYIRDGAEVLITTGEDGYGISESLPHGLYYLVETTAPNGYNLLEAPVLVCVTATSHETAFAVKIPNEPGMMLPETGGTGVYVYTVSGLVLCAAAICLIVIRKRIAE